MLYDLIKVQPVIQQHPGPESYVHNQVLCCRESWSRLPSWSQVCLAVHPASWVAPRLASDAPSDSSSGLPDTQAGSSYRWCRPAKISVYKENLITILAIQIQSNCPFKTLTVVITHKVSTALINGRKTLQKSWQIELMKRTKGRAWFSPIVLKITSRQRGNTPGEFAWPIIVWVFPELVTPYANSSPFFPFIRSSTMGRASLSNTDFWPSPSLNMVLKV